MSYVAVPPSYDENGNFKVVKESEETNQNDNNDHQKENKQTKGDKNNESDNNNNDKSKMISERWERLQSIRAKKEALDVCKTKRKSDNEESTTTQTKPTNNSGDKNKGKRKQGLTPITFVSPAQKAMDSIKPYMNPNPHLAGVTSKFDPQTALEKKLDVAVSKGDYDEAERLSDQIETQRVAAGVVIGVAARKYEKEKEASEKRQRENKKQRLFWGFDSKSRWESKGAM